jgi:hypothetical protein
VPVDLRELLRSGFRWTDPGGNYLVSNRSGWWRDARILSGVGEALADLFRADRPTVVIRVLVVDDWAATGAQVRALRGLFGAGYLGTAVIVDETTPTVGRELTIRGLLRGDDLTPSGSP